MALRGAGLAAFAAAGGAVAGIIIESGGASGGARVLLVAVASGLGLVAGYLVFRHTGQAVAAVSAAARSLAEGRFGQRAESSSRVTAAMVQNFNAMSARVRELFESMTAEHARLEAVFDAATDAMLALSRDTTVRFLNAAAARLLDTTSEAAIGRPFIETARDYELDALVRRAAAIPGASETSVVTFGPRRIPLRAAAVPIVSGGDWAVLLILNDLTEVQRLDQVRRDFLTNVSHELRTPLAAIRALVETVESGDVESDEAAAFLARIRQQVDRLTALVNELLDLSRIESGAIELKPEPVDLAALVAEAASLLRPRAEPAGVTVEGPPVPGLAVEADRPSLLRIVSNLLDNAVRYSPAGSTIHVETRDEGELVSLSVRDEGPGIGEQDLPRVFERFYKSDAARATAGVGLGLAIVKHLVRAHRGTVEAQSPPGSGAVFTVRLPKKFVR